MNKLKKVVLPLTEDEIKTQIALGTLPPEYKNDLCRYETPRIAKGVRRCRLCGEKCIKKGDEFYEVILTTVSTSRYPIYMNICIDCSWLSMQTIRRIIKKHKPRKSK